MTAPRIIAEIAAEFAANLRANIEAAHAAAEAHPGTFVIANSDCTLFIGEDGNQYRFLGIAGATFFTSKMTAHKVAQNWNRQDQVKAHASMTVTTLSIADAVAYAEKTACDLLAILAK